MSHRWRLTPPVGQWRHCITTFFRRVDIYQAFSLCGGKLTPRSLSCLVLVRQMCISNLSGNSAPLPAQCAVRYPTNQLTLPPKPPPYRLESLAFAPNFTARPVIQLTPPAHNARTVAFIKCQQMMPPFNFADNGAVMGSKVRVGSWQGQGAAARALCSHICCVWWLCCVLNRKQQCGKVGRNSTSEILQESSRHAVTSIIISLLSVNGLRLSKYTKNSFLANITQIGKIVWPSGAGICNAVNFINLFIYLFIYWYVFIIYLFV